MAQLSGTHDGCNCDEDQQNGVFRDVLTVLTMQPAIDDTLEVHRSSSFRREATEEWDSLGNVNSSQ